MLNIEESNDNHTEVYQNASVYIPVEITSHADSGEIKTSCCGKPTVAFHEDRRNGKYCFTIMQPICVELPIELSAEALLGNLRVKYGEEVDPGCELGCEETYPRRELGCEETAPNHGPVFEESVEFSSPEPEQPKRSPSKNWYKVYF